MAIKNLRGILFDLDDTLIPSEALYAAGLRAAHARFQSFQKMPWSRFSRLYKTARAQVKTQQNGRPACRNRVLYFQRFVELCLGHSSPRITLALFDAFNTAWRKISPAPVQAIVAPLAQRFKVGLITNQVVLTQLQKLERLDPLGDLFKVLVTSEEVGVEKPAALIFKAACKKLGLTPAQILLVGDSWSADVQGGLKAGLHVAFLSAKPPAHKLPRRCFHIRSLAELAPLVID